MANTACIADASLRTAFTSSAGTSSQLHRGAFLGGRGHLKAKTCRSASTKVSFKVEAAVSKATKEATIEKVKAQVDDSLVVAGLTYQGMSVGEVQALRRTLPPDAKIMIMKNTLMKRSIADSPFEPLAEHLTGPNAYLFVGEDGVKEAFKATSEAIKAFNKTNKDAGKEVHYVGACMENNFIPPTDIARLEKLPSKLDLIAKVAGIVKAVPTKLGVGVKQLPTKIGVGIAAIRDQKAEAEA